MGKRDLVTSYEVILVTKQLLENNRERQQIEGSILLYVPMQYRKGRDILEKTDFTEREEDEYVNGLSRAYRDEFERIRRNLDHNIPLEDMLATVQRLVTVPFPKLIEIARSIDDAVIYQRRRDAIEDPYIFSLLIARDTSRTLIQSAQAIGADVESYLSVAYAARGVHGLKGSERLNRALRAEYMAFTAILREVLRTKGRK
ncbi:MAG: hypothetical protein KJ574_04175 [Nanoarchaeota archaeon]|nr:hypothetical protein [Nanoarchaeota archaeon]